MLELPDYQSLRQGQWENCWLLAALVGVAYHRPGELRSWIQPQPDGRFAVTFPGRSTLIADPNDGSCGTESGPWRWANVVEAAAHQILDAVRPRVASFGIGIDLLTGRGRTGHTNFLGFGFAPGWRIHSRGEWIAERLTLATETGRIMLLGGSDGWLATPKQPWISPRHCYAIFDYTQSKNRVRLRDPRGIDDGERSFPIPADRKDETYGPGEFWLTPAEVEASFCGLSIEND
jgi:hypothetical protein